MTMRRGIVLLLLLSLVLVVGCGKKTTPANAGSIQVTVEDDNGDAVNGVTLTLTDSEGKKTTAFSDSKGEASFAGLADGDYDLEGAATGYAADSTSLSVEGDEQEATLTLSSTSASEDDGSGTEQETGNTSILENVNSYRWKWSSMEEGKTNPSVAEGAFEKPDHEYFRTGDGEDVNEIYRVGNTVKMRSGTDGEWNTFTGDAAEGMMGMSGIYTSMFGQDYSSSSKDDSGFKRSDGGNVNGYSTQKYVYEISINGAVTSTTAWVIDRGEFKGGTTRWETKSTKDGKTTSFTWDVFDLNKSIGIELP
jgi:hypothetical protein